MKRWEAKLAATVLSMTMGATAASAVQEEEDNAGGCNAVPNLECVLEKATQAAMGVEDRETRGRLASTIAGKYAAAGRLYGAMRSAKRIHHMRGYGNAGAAIKAGWKKELESRADATELGMSRAEIEEEIEAMSWREIERNAFYRSCAAVREGSFKEARERAREIAYTPDRIEILHYTASEQAQAGQREGAARAVDEIVRLAETGETRWWTLKALLDSARLQIEIGEEDAARATLEKTGKLRHGDAQWNVPVRAPSAKRLRAEAVVRVGPIAGTTAVQAEAGWSTEALASARSAGTATERALAHRIIARTQFERGEVASAAQTLETARAMAATIEDDRRRIRALRETARMQHVVGAHDAARETFSEALREAVNAEAGGKARGVLARMAEEYAARREHREARAAAAAIENAQRRTRTYLRIAQIAARRGDDADPYEAIDIATEEMAKGAGASDRTWRAMSEVQIEIGRPRDALASAKKVEDPLQRTYALVEASDELIEAGEHELAGEGLTAAAEATEKIGDEERRESLRRHIAGRQIRNRQFDAALEIVRAQASEQIQIDGLITVARGQIGDGQIAAAKETFGQAMEKIRAKGGATLFEQMHYSDIFDDARAHLKDGETEKEQAAVGMARAIADAMRKPGERVDALRTIGRVLTKMGRANEGREAFAAAVRAARAIEPDLQREFALERIGEAQVELGLGPAAAAALLAAAALMQQRGERAESDLRDIAGTLARAGSYEEASAIAETIGDGESRRRARRQIMGNQIAAGEFEEAMGTAGRMEDEEPGIGRRAWVDRMAWVETAATNAGDRENAERARAAVREAMERDADVRTHAIDTRYWTGERISAWEELHGRNAAEQARREIEDHLLETGQYSAAARHANGIEDRVERRRALHRAAASEAWKGDIGAALERARSVSEAGDRAWALLGLARGARRTGGAETVQKILGEAIEAAQRTEDALEKTSILMVAAEKRNEEGERSEATRTAEAAAEAAKAIEDDYARATMLARIANVHSGQGKQGRARRAAEAAHEAAGMIEDAQKRDAAMAETAIARRRANQFERAMESAGEIGDPMIRTRTQLKIAEISAHADEDEKEARAIEASMKTGESVKDPKIYGKISAEIALAQARRGELAAALERAEGIVPAAIRANSLVNIAQHAPPRGKSRWEIQCEAR